jgi:hypothetical protein
MNPINEAQLPCPARALWQEPPPSLGSGIPARIRSARPIPPRSRVTDLLPLHPPSFYIDHGELRQTVWTAPDLPGVSLPEGEPAAVNLPTEFPTFAAQVLSAPQIPASADLGNFTATFDAVPSIPCSGFSGSIAPSLPAGGSQRPIGVCVAPAQASWQLTSTSFTPRRQIVAPEPAMRPLPVPESGCRPVGAVAVRPTRMAGIVEHRPWKLVENPQPSLPVGENVAPVPGHRLANAHPAKSLSPRSVFHDTTPTWKTFPNSYVRRIEIGFFAGSAAAIAISPPLPPIAH